MMAHGGIIALAACVLAAIALAHRRAFERERTARPTSVPTLRARAAARFSGRGEHARRARQLAMALPMASELLRGGLTPEAALSTVADSVDSPLGPELSRAVDETASAGRTLVEALDALANRTASNDLALLADAVAVQKEGGGNLADVLDSIGKSIADKAEAQGHLEAITSSARLSAALVAATPPLLLAFLSLGSPAYMADFWDSGLWPIALGLAATLDLAGLICVRRLYRVDLT